MIERVPAWGCDVSVAEIVAAVVRDSISTSRMDMLTLQLAQQKIINRCKLVQVAFGVLRSAKPFDPDSHNT